MKTKLQKYIEDLWFISFLHLIPSILSHRGRGLLLVEDLKIKFGKVLKSSHSTRQIRNIVWFELVQLVKKFERHRFKLGVTIHICGDNSYLRVGFVSC